MRPNASFFASISSPTPPFRRPRRAQRRSRARRRPPSSCSAPPRSCAAPPPLDFLPLFGAASTASRRAQAPLNRPTTPYQSRPGHPPRCPPSFPRLPRPDRSAPSRACSRRDATRPCMPSATASRAWAVAQPSRLSIGRLPRRRRRRLARRERRAWCGGFGNPPATLRTVIRQLHAHDWPTIASFTSSAACRCSCAGIAPPAFHPRSPSRTRCAKRLRRFYRTGDRRRRKTKRGAKRCDRCAAEAPSITSNIAIDGGHWCSIVRQTHIKSTSWRRSVAIYPWMIGRPCRRADA